MFSSSFILVIKDLQRNGSDIVSKYLKDLNAVDFCQELAIFRKLETYERLSAFDHLQHLCKHDLQEAFLNIDRA